MVIKKPMFIIMLIVFPVLMMAKEPEKSAACPVTDAKNKHNDEIEQERINKVLDALATEMELSCGCQAGWVRHGNACYYIDDTPTTKWLDAKEKCENMGADLPIIKSSAENEFIVKLAQKQETATREGVWLGMQRKDKTLMRDFYWIDGSPLEKQTYLNWQTGEPNMHLGGEHCGNMYVISNRYGEPGKWNDLRCNCTNYAGGEAACPVVLCQKPL